MDSITIGLWVSGGMLVMVLLGMRVAFAAGMAVDIVAWLTQDQSQEAYEERGQHKISALPSTRKHA